MRGSLVASSPFAGAAPLSGLLPVLSIAANVAVLALAFYGLLLAIDKDEDGHWPPR